MPVFGRQERKPRWPAARGRTLGFELSPLRLPSRTPMKIIRHITPAGSIAYARDHGDGRWTEASGGLEEGFTDTGKAVEVLKVLAPVVPVAIYCTGLNYRQHAIETNSPIPQYPVLFMKAPSALQHPGEPIFLPRWLASTKVDYECELAIVIGRPARNVPRSEALKYIAGYTCANDVSARDWQKEGGGSQWCRGKTFDTFLPLGPCLVTADELGDASNRRISTTLNGEVLQDSTTSDMIFDVATLIEFYSGSTTLQPGTVIITGTPQGVGMAQNPPRFLRGGDEVVVEIEGIGRLSNPVVDEEPSPGGPGFKL
jgi:2-keto-4-pentenoate hydratase/2-oxohepta-3-ene-1,7-dioic acid hydratase in catechol pathway